MADEPLIRVTARDAETGQQLDATVTITPLTDAAPSCGEDFCGECGCCLACSNCTPDECDCARFIYGGRG